MTRILYVVDVMKQRAGITSFIKTYIDNFDRKEIQVDILALEGSEDDIVQHFNDIKCRVFLAPSPRSLKGIYAYICFVNRLLKNNSYDIIHSHFVQVSTTVFTIARIRGVKYLIAHSHNTKLSDSRIKAIVNAMLFYPSRYMADSWFSCSKEAGVALFSKKFVNNKKSIIMRNAIDTLKYQYSEFSRNKIRQKYGLDGTVILFVGGFRQQKNIPFLIDVFYELKKKSESHKYTLVLIGDGEEKDMICKRIEKMQLEKDVLFMGARNDVQEFMCASDLFVLPSLYEGLGLVLIEAQANGLKCVASDAIPLESKVTNNITYVSLDESKSVWVDIIESQTPVKCKDRNACSTIVKNRGYDIIEQAKTIEYFYRNLK